MVMREARSADTMTQVRLMIYNIRYATGTGPAFHLPVPGAGYFVPAGKSCRGSPISSNSRTPT